MVSFYHLILMCVERYIAIVYPLKYETRFTDRALKWSIATVWVVGIIVSMGWAFWLINADLSKCDLIPTKYHLVDVVAGYVPVCVCMFFVYGRILFIWWHQRKRISHVNPVPVTPATSGWTVSISVPATDVSNTDKMENAKGKPAASDGGPASNSAAVKTVSDVSTAVVEQQRQKIKSRRREFKAVYLTGAIVGTFVIFWFPGMFGRVLLAADYHNQVAVNYLILVGGAIGVANFTFSWAIYAAASKSYRRAYRQMFIRIGCCGCKNMAINTDNSLIL